jgi:hypothetical protein
VQAPAHVFAPPGVTDLEDLAQTQLDVTVNVLADWDKPTSGAVHFAVDLSQALLNGGGIICGHYVRQCDCQHPHVRDTADYVLPVKAPVEADTRSVVKDVAMQRRARDSA